MKIYTIRYLILGQMNIHNLLYELQCSNRQADMISTLVGSRFTFERISKNEEISSNTRTELLVRTS